MSSVRGLHTGQRAPARSGRPPRETTASTHCPSSAAAAAPRHPRCWIQNNRYRVRARRLRDKPSRHVRSQFASRAMSKRRRRVRLSSISSSAVSRSKSSVPFPDWPITRATNLIARAMTAATTTVCEDHDAVCSWRDGQRSLDYCSTWNAHFDGCRVTARAPLRVLFLRRAIGMGSRRMRS